MGWKQYGGPLFPPWVVTLYGNEDPHQPHQKFVIFSHISIVVFRLQKQFWEHLTCYGFKQVIYLFSIFYFNIKRHLVAQLYCNHEQLIKTSCVIFYIKHEQMLKFSFTKCKKTNTPESCGLPEVEDGHWHNQQKLN